LIFDFSHTVWNVVYILCEAEWMADQQELGKVQQVSLASVAA